LGSGKTQTSIVIGEAFKFRSINNKIIPGRNETKVLIVVPNALVDQYYLEIIGKVENETIKSASGEILINGERQYYMDELVRQSITNKYLEIEELSKNLPSTASQVEQLKKDIKRLTNEERINVERVYEILSHDTFLNRIMKFKENVFVPGPYIEYLRKPSGLLIIDEVQNLVSAIGTNYRKLLYALRFYAHPDFRVVLLTATPIYDKPFEFGLIMNLLRPRIPFPDGRKNFDEYFGSIEMKNKELFKKMTSGYVSYFKGGNPEAYPYKKTVIMHHPMSIYQYTSYKSALISDVEEQIKHGFKNKNDEYLVKISSSESKNDELNISGVFTKSNLFCNIVFPELKLSPEELESLSKETILENGIKEFRKVLTTQNTKDINLPEEQRVSNILKLVSNFSSKFSKVAELIINADGPVFVYSNYVYYGVSAMGVVMGSLGYREYPGKGPKGSYFVWSGKAKPELIPKAKQLFNSSANKDGSLLKIMFGTQTVMEGVDFKNVRQVHVLDPWWNDSRVQQIIARAIRLCSHKELPASKRIVDVFIHLSTLGSGETLYKVQLKSKPGKNVYSSLILQNPAQKNSKLWLYNESYITIGKDKIITVHESKETFLASDISSFSKLSDPELTKNIGEYKGLDSISVQEYMYNSAMKKLRLNRQFEQCIKEVAVDCNLNKYGNVVRLEEMYTPYPGMENTYELNYLNYSTGEVYKRLGVKSVFNQDLQENILELRDIFNDTAKKSDSFKFKSQNQTIVLNKSLLFLENIKCDSSDYAFENLPQKIIEQTLNKELLPILIKKPLSELQLFLYNVNSKKIELKDKNLYKKVSFFISKDAVVEKQRIIEKLVEYNIGTEEIWQLYPLDKLREEFKKFKLF
jgi:superfamily II DNA or RNA helicase